MTERVFSNGENEMATELVERPVTDLTLESVGHLIVSPDLDPDRMKGLLDVYERMQANHAAQEFANALSGFQTKCPVVEKVRTAKIQTKAGGSYEYKFANLEDVMSVITPYLKEYKLGISFSTESTENSIKATCRIRHGTHYEDHTLTVPVPAMNVNDTQRFGAALSYAKRYALCAALNIVVADEDTDASGLAQTITEDQMVTLNEWIESTNTDVKRFCKWLAVENLAQIPAAQFSTALYELKRKAGQK